MSGFNILDYFYQMFKGDNEEEDMEISSNNDMEISSFPSNNDMSTSSNNSNVYVPPFTPSFILTKDNARVHLMIQKEFWTSKSPKIKDQNLQVYIDSEYSHLFCDYPTKELYWK